MAPEAVESCVQEMITKVVERRPDYNNPNAIASSQVMTNTKVAYYRFFAWLYSLMGGLTDSVMVNSTWTKNHIDSLWQLPLPRRSESDTGEYRPVNGLLSSLFRAFGASGQRPAARTVFPPCNTALLASLRLGHRERVVVSVAQFRPEKDHALQLRAFALFLQKGERFLFFNNSSAKILHFASTILGCILQTPRTRMCGYVLLGVRGMREIKSVWRSFAPWLRSSKSIKMLTFV
jgi:glycosyltransferase involved in cell wall biosynthesis